MNTFQRTCLAAAVFASTALAGFADDLAKLEGNGTAKKTGPDGNSYTQTIEVKKGKFQFRVLRGSDDLVIYAEGTLKTETSGPFSVAHFTDIKAGASESDTNPINDDRASVYLLSDDTWTVAQNFDKERDGQKPSAEVYTRTKK
jgi:hypothetical protein